MGIINPDQVCSYDFTTVEGLAKRFPQLSLNDSQSLDSLKIEFMDFKHSPAELPSLNTYKSATGDEKPRPGKFWNEVSRMRTLNGEMRLPLLVKLMTGLMSTPSSNADSERGFSILRKIHSNQRPTLKQSTLISLMSVKFNSEECCHDSFSEQLLSNCKKATVDKQ